MTRDIVQENPEKTCSHWGRGVRVAKLPSADTLSISTSLQVTLAVLWTCPNCYHFTIQVFGPPVGLKALTLQLLVQPSTDWAPNLQPYLPRTLKTLDS